MVLQGAVGEFWPDVQLEFGRFVGAVVENEDAVVQIGTNHGILVAFGLDGAAAAVADGGMLGTEGERIQRLSHTLNKAGQPIDVFVLALITSYLYYLLLIFQY